MKKSILKLAILLSAFAVLATACSKNDDPTNEKTEGKYTVKMDGKTIATGTTTEVGWLETAASMSEGDNFTVLVSSVPEQTGGVYTFDASNTTGTVSIMGKNLLLTNDSDELYFSVTGSVTRVSETKISFEGTCTALMSTETHTFSGTLESDVFKINYN
ncbi:MAG: hypothetical protein JXP36_17385 [Bacteroidales bacterium]|nr:hypothetical protein [Bacteroidales bacterium]